MPKSLPIKLISSFENLADYDDFVIYFPLFYTYNCRYTHCDICNKDQNHKMKVQYHKCNNVYCLDSGECPKRFISKLFTQFATYYVLVSSENERKITQKSHFYNYFFVYLFS